MGRWCKLLVAWAFRRFAEATQPMCLCAFLAVLLPTVASAQSPPHPIPESERWATITHAGNDHYVPPTWVPEQTPSGRVAYEYQISRTEVTAGEWLEFVQAYGPYVENDYASSSVFTSVFVRRRSNGAGGYTYSLTAESVRNKPVEIGWRFAARYVNWLHNDRALTQNAFEGGVYETSTFGENPDGTLTDQLERNPGSRYWIPSADEWVKSAYWDPNRFGIAQPGYWHYPNGTDTPLIPGVPGVGQTSAGIDWSPSVGPDVAAYRDVQSPWGLWDLSGGKREWLEIGYRLNGSGLWLRGLRGSQISVADPMYSDSIDFPGGAPPASIFGLRIARAVPGPGACLLLSAVLTTLQRRNRTCVLASHNSSPCLLPSFSPRSPLGATFTWAQPGDLRPTS